MGIANVEIVLLALVSCLAVATARPQSFEPFLSFKNGNVRVNFGGYHAEAGLGGLLSGGRTAGGLHASAGTPSGAHAQAGLGGLLGGNGFTGGSLGASAGLGRGAPQAAAGLGGLLSGQGGQGGLFAGATTGGNVGQAAVGKQVHTEVSQSVPQIASKTVETHIYQPPPTVTKTVHTETFSAPVATNVHVEKRVKTKITPKKEKTRISTVVRSDVKPSSVVHVEKYVGSVPSQQNYYFDSYAGAPFNTGAAAGLGGSFYGGGFGGVGTNYGSSAQANAGASFSGTGQTGAGYEDGSYYVKSAQPNAQLFDDIFNIPISTLAAVNQLLRNKVQ